MTPIQYALALPEPEHEPGIPDLICEASAHIERGLVLLDRAEDKDRELSTTFDAVRRAAVALRYLRYTAPAPFPRRARA